MLTLEEWEDRWWEQWNAHRKAGSDGQEAARLAEFDTLAEHGPMPGASEPAAVDSRASMAVRVAQLEPVDVARAIGVPAGLVDGMFKPCPSSMRGWLSRWLNRMRG